METIFNYLTFCKKNISRLDVFILLYVFLTMADIPHPLFLYAVIGYGILIYIIIFFKCHLIDCKLSLTFYFCIFLLIYIAVMGFPVGGFLYTSKMIAASLIHFSFFIIYIYYTKKDDFQKTAFMRCLFLIIVLLMVYAYYSYTAIGVNARRIADHSVDYEEIVLGKGYFFAYAVSLIGVYLFDRICYANIKDVRIKVFFWMFVIMAIFVVTETLSTTTMLAFIGGLVITYVVPPSIKGTRTSRFSQLLVSFCLIIFIAICINFLGNLFLLIGSSGDSIMSTRLISLGYMLNGEGGYSGDYSAIRFLIPLKSFQTFLEHPIFGISYMHGNGFFKPTFFGAGNHCEWVDALCNYGLVGGIPFLYIYFHSIWNVYNNRIGRMGLGLLASFLIMGTFNPFRCFATSITVFLILPILADKFGNNKYRVVYE